MKHFLSIISVLILTTTLAGNCAPEAGLASSRLQNWREAGAHFDFKSAGTDGAARSDKIFYREAGQGPALLLVHGFPTSSYDWHAVLPTLAKRFRVIAPDMLGYGYSDKPADYPYSTHRQADLHEALLADRGITRVHILTYSFGASVVQELLARQGSRAANKQPGPRIESVTFLNGGLFPETNRPKLVQRVLLSPLGPLVAGFMKKSTLDKNLRSIFGPNTQPDPRLIDDIWYLINRADGRARIPDLIGYLNDRQTHSKRWRDALIQTTSRLLLVVGTSDSISGPDMAAQYQEVIPDPRVILLDDIGHYPQLEAPAITARHVIDFALP